MHDVVDDGRFCWGCAFFHEVGDHDGHCRRRAPLPSTSIGELAAARWPIVDICDWCGEWKVKTNA